MNITTRSTMVVSGNVKVYRFRSDIDMLKAIRQVTYKGPSVLYCNSCGFLSYSTAEEYLQAMLADQELYKKHSGLLVRVNDITIDKSELNQGKERMELKTIADSMAAYYADIILITQILDEGLLMILQKRDLLYRYSEGKNSNLGKKKGLGIHKSVNVQHS